MRVEAVDGRRLPRAATVALGVVLFAAAVALPLLRQRGAHSWDTIWAEDGSIYFQQVHDHGFLPVVLRSYAGYLQLPPRLLAGIAAALPIRSLAVVFALVEVVVAALLASFGYWATAGWIESRLVRVALASLIVLMPALVAESTANVTNSIWIFAAVAPWAIVSRQETRAATALRAAVAFLGAAATLVTVVFAPLAIVWAWYRRTRSAITVALVFGLGLVLQLVIAITAPPDQPVVPVRSASRLLGIMNVRVFAEYAIGDSGIRMLWNDARTVLVVFPPIVVGALLVACAWRAPRRAQVLAATFSLYAIVTFVVPVWGRGTNWVTMTTGEARALAPGGHAAKLSGFFLTHGPGGTYVSASRFSVLPVFMLASAFAVAIGSTRRSAHAVAVNRWVRAAFVVQLSVLAVVGFRAVNARSSGPEWVGALRRAYSRSCVDRPGVTMARIPTPPGRFAVHLPCAQLGERIASRR